VISLSPGAPAGGDPATAAPVPWAAAVRLVYEADATPMPHYLAAHHALEAAREAALASADGAHGPRAMVVGPTDAGKSTISRVLLNYAHRGQWECTAVDLDVGQGGITVPGTLCAAPVSGPVGPAAESLASDASAPPLAFYFGHASPSENPALFRFCVDRLGGLLAARAAATPPRSRARAAGWVTNWMGWCEGLGYDLLLHAVGALAVDTLFVVGDEALAARLASDLSAAPAAAAPRPPRVVTLPRSPGVTARDQATRAADRAGRVREYFYGPPTGPPLSPVMTRVKAADLARAVHRAGGGPRAPATALPIGAAAVSDPLRIAPLPAPPGADLVHSLLAVSHAAEAATLASTNIAGFLYVAGYEPAGGGTFSVLAPCAGPRPGDLLLAGTIKVAGVCD
jgi:polyribonucleotide 5'-hydroxyl-kinase